MTTTGKESAEAQITQKERELSTKIRRDLQMKDTHKHAEV
jgi:hypothetical protein